MDNPNVLILSPHCDDVPLSLGASLLEKAWGEAPHAIVVFSQSAYTRFATWDNSIAETSALRQAEERRAAELAGYTVEFLPFAEPWVRPGYENIGQVFDPGRPIEEETIWPEVRESLLERLKEFEGAVLSPLGLGDHIDHRIVRACLIEAAGQNRSILPVFYEDLPYAAQYSSLHIHERVPQRFEKTRVEPVLLHTGTIEAKLELLSVYDSQLTEGQLHNVRAHWDCRGQGELVWAAPGSVPLR
jgi:LmbE family N-acetylglucosaminyl deacetylase